MSKDERKVSNAIDMHCDTLMLTYFEHGESGDLYKNRYNIDVKRLVSGGALCQCFAIFIPDRRVYEEYGVPERDEDTYIRGCISVFRNTMARHPDVIASADHAAQIEQNHARGLVSGMLTMEDGVAVHGSMQKLDSFYEAGIRILSLTWNHANCFGAPNSRDPEIMNTGLTDFGKEAVKHMQDIGMIVDVSHLSDGGFRDVCRLADKPFVATHSNCRAVCNHPRNMTDDMIKALREHDGVMGINFCPEFLDDTPGVTKSRIEGMVAMALHEKKVAGVDVIALGTDFDGFDGQLEIDGPDKMVLLKDALVNAGFTVSEVEQIMYGNVMRVFRETLHG